MLAEFLITLQCNYSCAYCFIPDFIKRKKIKERRIEAIVAELKQRNFDEIDITGGEPFLEKKRLIETINLSVANDIKIRSIATNGSIYDPEVALVLRDLNGFVLYVGLDAATPATYQRMRNSLEFEKVIKNIQRFIKKDIEVILGLVVTKINYKEVSEIIKLAEILGAVGISIGGLVPIGEGKKVAKWSLNKSEMEEVFRICKESEKKIKLIGLGDNTCPAGSEKWCVLPNGNIYPCALLVSIKEAKVGNLFQKKSISSSRWFRNFIQIRVPLKCQKCHLPSLCPGGCKALFYSKNLSSFKGSCPFSAIF